MNRVIRSFLTALFIATAVQFFAVGVLAPVLPRQVCQPRMEITRHFTFPAAPSMMLNNSDGAVVVQVNDKPTIDILAVVRVYANEEQADAVRSHMDTLFKVNADDFAVNIVTEPALRPDEIHLEVDYTLTVPKGTNIAIEGTNGNVTVAKGCGRARIRGNNRDIRLEEPHGPVDVEITNGRIQVYDAFSDTTLRTINGKIYAHMRGGALDAATTNGNIVVTVLENAVTSCDLKSMNGGITLVMPEICSARVEAVTGRGTVKSDFDVKPLLGNQRQRQLRGIIGSGETRLTMNSLNGNIWLAKE